MKKEHAVSLHLAFVHTLFSSQVLRTEDIFAAVYRKDDSSALEALAIINLLNLLENETQSLPQALVERLLAQLELLHTEVGCACSMFPVYIHLVLW